MSKRRSEGMGEGRGEKMAGLIKRKRNAAVKDSGSEREKKT